MWKLVSPCGRDEDKPRSTEVASPARDDGGIRKKGQDSEAHAWPFWDTAMHSSFARQAPVLSSAHSPHSVRGAVGTEWVNAWEEQRGGSWHRWALINRSHGSRRCWLLCPGSLENTHLHRDHSQRTSPYSEYVSDPHATDHRGGCQWTGGLGKDKPNF